MEFSLCTLSPPPSNKRAVPSQPKTGLVINGHWDVSGSCIVSETIGDSATFAFQGTIHITPFYATPLTRLLTGVSLEVWGGQLRNQEQINEGSTYILDSGEPSINTNMPTTMPSFEVVLFSTSGLANSLHTLTVVNGGVTLGLVHFGIGTTTPSSSSSKTQIPTHCPGRPPVGPGLSSSIQGTSGSSTSANPSSRYAMFLALRSVSM